MNMFCPRCGKQFDVATSFCRDCGLALDDVSNIVNADAASAPVMTTRPNFKVMRIGIVVFIFGLVIGLINGGLRDFNLFPPAYGKVVFFAFIAIGMLMLGSGFLFPVKSFKKRKRAKADADVADLLNTGPLDAQLPPAKIIDADISFPKDSREHAAAEPASVTENTTRQLG
jgi:hypothetical protein